MVPLQPRMADKHYVIGQRYIMEERLERSSASHRAYFAEINDLWSSLSDDQMEQWPNPDALRKAALIQAGFRDEKSIVLSSKAEAQRVAAFVKPQDEFAVVSLSGATVVVLTAKSQSLRAMGKEDFNLSKEAVLNAIAQMIGVERGASSTKDDRHELEPTPPETPPVDRTSKAEASGSGQESPARGHADPSATRPATAQSQAHQGPQEAQATDALDWAVSIHQKVDSWRGSPDALKTQWVGEWMATDEWAELKARHEGTALALRDAVKAKMEALRAA